MGKNKVNIQLSPAQAQIYTAQNKSVAGVAGFGSGKTEVAIFRCFDSVFEFPKNDFLYVAPTLPLVKDIWYPKAEQYLNELGHKFHINESRNIISIKGHGKVYCRSMERPDRIVGFEVLDAFLDELDIMPQDKALNVWRKTKARARQKPKYGKGIKKLRKKYGLGKKRNQTFVTTTPEGFRATYKLFKKEPVKDSFMVQMSTYSNLHNLPEDYIEELMANYPAQLVEAYIMGIFTNLTSGRVWTSYDRELNRTHAKIESVEEPLCIGADFNVGRGCAVVYVPRPEGFCAVGEVVNTIDTPRTIKAIQTKWPNHPIQIIPDSTGDNRKSTNATISDIRLLKAAGYRVTVNSRNPNIKDRVTASNAMMCNGLGQRRMLVNDYLCPYFADGLEQQVYDDNGMPEKGAEKWDDITDAGTYPIAKLFPIEGRKARLRKVRGT